MHRYEVKLRALNDLLLYGFLDDSDCIHSLFTIQSPSGHLAIKPVFHFVRATEKKAT